MAAPPRLMDDLIGEILLRLPPEDPECLVRASLVCKPWRRLVSDPSFSRRYREFHSMPPLLGLLGNVCDFSNYGGGRFIPIKETPPTLNHRRIGPDCRTIDCRHGRVLLHNCKTGLIVWDPITNSQQHIGMPEIIKNSLYRLAAAVLCAVDGCDHLGCRGGGPSLVVFLDIDRPIQQVATASARVYSTETGAWNAAGVSSVQFDSIMFQCWKTIGSSLLAGDALYFVVIEGRRIILKYDLAGSRLSVMSPPPFLPGRNMLVLMKAEGGGLGACCLDGHSLHLSAWRTGPGGISEWERGRVIHLEIGDPSTKLDVVDFAEGAGSIFLRENNGVFAVELKSGQTRKIGKGGYLYLRDIFPFMSFYTPEIMLPPDCKRQ